MKLNFVIFIIVLIIIFLIFSVFWLSKNIEKPIVCIQDAKLCPDGSYVGRVSPDCNFAPCPKENLIQIESPTANEVVSSPILIKGKARGFWFFEAEFPAELYDENNNLIARTSVFTKNDWMTEDFVSFEANLSFKTPATERGVLVLKKDNPSGLPEYDDELRIPLLFNRTRTVNLYYYNPNLDRDESGENLCSKKGLVAIERKIPLTKTPIKDTIKLLLNGELTPQERNQGIATEYPLEGLVLKNAVLNNGLLTLTFEDPNFKTSGGSCRVGILWFQIEATAKQFSEVKEVKFYPEELFQP